MNVIVMVGLVGAGKTTYAKKYFPNYYRVSQDELGSRDACIKAATEILDKGRDLLIDRTNVSKEQRKHWIDLALYYGANAITAVYLHVDPEECVDRLTYRKDHPTIPVEMLHTKKRDIVYKFYNKLEIPQLDEGFSSILTTRN